MCILQNGNSIADLTVIASPQEDTAKGKLYRYHFMHKHRSIVILQD